MYNVKWNCPHCNKENTSNVKFNDYEAGLIVSDNCEGCKEEFQLLIDFEPVVQEVSLKRN